MMTTHIDTIVGNKGLSEKLTGMLVDLKDTIGSAFETIEDKIEKRTRAGPF